MAEDNPLIDCRISRCEDGEFCALDEELCRPSSCFCDASTGGWICTADCGPAYSCQAPPSCEGPDPSVDCSTTGCNDDQDCVIEEGACLPSSCSCDDEGWICTEDCGEQHSCTSKSGEVCDTPDPSKDCRDTGCDGVQECLPTDGCRPSTCGCDSGDWFCTRDCLELYACQDPSGPVCEGTNPSHDCTSAVRCPAGSSCLLADIDACRPSECSCTNEGWTCTSDCQPAHVCEHVLACDGPTPPGRTQEGCDQGFDCVVRGIDTECTPSRCECTNGQWLCTRDCGGGGVCIANI